MFCDFALYWIVVTMTTGTYRVIERMTSETVEPEISYQTAPGEFWATSIAALLMVLSVSAAVISVPFTSGYRGLSGAICGLTLIDDRTMRTTADSTADTETGESS